MTTIQSTDPELELAKDLSRFYDDPLGHVLYSYPWGTGSLKGRTGPQRWQRDFLEDVGARVRVNKFNGTDPVPPIQFSTASGHGIGKSALVAWIIRWIMDTRPYAKGVVTANTGPQLQTKTWGELAKWHNLGITKHWFELTSGSGSLSYYHKEFREQWRCDGQTCREENSEAFAGLHAANSTPFYIFDEASGVPDKIFEVREGGLTDGEPMVFDFGNPTRNSGRFFENMVGKFRDRYIRRSIDSRDVEQTNKELFETWAETYGKDSDFFKVRVKGEFPASGDLQFIPTDHVEACVGVDIHVGETDPMIMGVDVARFGDDDSVIWLRHGRDADTPGFKRYSGVDTMTLASEVARLATEYQPDAVFIDGGGVGGGVIDRARQLGVDVIEVNFGGKSPRPGFANMRAYMWSQLRDAIRDGIGLPDDADVKSDLTGIEYGYNLRGDLQLERKDDMKKRGLKSPDLADALALTYCMPVYPNRTGYSGQAVTNHIYDPFD
jgi:hypothetical protein